MKRFFFLLAGLLAAAACTPSSYLPRMAGVVRLIDSTCPEVSGLCPAPAGDVLWIADSEERTLNLYGEAICVDHANSCIWVGDDTTSRIYQIHFDDL